MTEWFEDWFETAEYLNVYGHRNKEDAKNLYLAYHEGLGGYKRGSYKSQPWLMSYAKKVNDKAWVYHSQLAQCQADLPKKHWWS